VATTGNKSKASTKATAKTMPKWQRSPEALVSTFQRVVGDFPLAQQRKMFGYPAAFVNGHMFTCLFENSMIVRLPDEDRARLLQIEGASLFEPMPGRPMREYVVVPRPMVEDSHALLSWLEKSFAYAAALPPKTPKPKPAKRKL
jgi:TfoX/Sxy family transcriptional regulator of competence genes